MGTGSATSLQPGCDIPGVAREPITCRYADRFGTPAACGAFDLDHHQRAAEAGVCCVVLAFDLDGHDNEIPAPTGPDWPDFTPGVAGE